MALTVDCNDGGNFTVEQCFDEVLKTVRIDDIDSMISAAPALKRLSNNRDEIASRLCDYLKEFAVVDYGGMNYSPNSFVLSPPHPNIIIRANIWLPLCKDQERQPFEANLFAYHRAHNHNFHFLTIGHFGPGYVTDIFEYKRTEVQGFIGEHIALQSPQRTSLTNGKIMFFRADSDIHIQYPPPSVSVSLNVIFAQDSDRMRDQYFFDIDESKISGYSDTLSTKRISLLEIAAQFANEKVIDLLLDLATAHPCPRTRLQALNTLSVAIPSRSCELQLIASRDQSEMVRSFITTPVPVSNPQGSFDPAFMQLI